MDPHFLVDPLMDEEAGTCHETAEECSPDDIGNGDIEWPVFSDREVGEVVGGVGEETKEGSVHGSYLPVVLFYSGFYPKV